MSISYLHNDFNKDALHGKVCQISNLGPTFIRWPGAALGSPGTTEEAARPGSPGPGLGLPWAQALATSFVVPGAPKSAPPQRMNMDPKLLISNFFRGGFGGKIYSRKQ